METHQLESLGAPGPIKNPNPPITPRMRDKCETEGIRETDDRGSGRSAREATGSEPPSLQGSLAPDEWVVQGFGQPHAAACLDNPQEDHFGAIQPVSPHTPPGGEYPPMHWFVPSGGIGTYGGQYRVGGMEATE